MALGNNARTDSRNPFRDPSRLTSSCQQATLMDKSKFLCLSSVVVCVMLLYAYFNGINSAIGGSDNSIGAQGKSQAKEKEPTNVNNQTIEEQKIVKVVEEEKTNEVHFEHNDVELFTYYEEEDLDNDNFSVGKSEWDHFPKESNLKVLTDEKLKPLHRIEPIDKVHSNGLLHRGIWIAVLRETQKVGEVRNGHYEVLILKRAQTLKTCPGAWGLVGEHSNPHESWKQTAIRALDEELQIDVFSENNHIGNGKHDLSNSKDRYNRLINIFPDSSILVQTDYNELHRKDLQATGIFAVLFSSLNIEKIQPDEEVSEMKWVSIEDLKSSKYSYCNREINDLAKLIGKQLNTKGFT